MMANPPVANLHYQAGCGDCCKRLVELPAALPEIGDDFDWDVRDYDGYRLFMLEQLAARFGERRSWTPADMEVVLVETLSVVLDQLSDMNDRIQAESFLETARKPASVRRLLEMIGYKPELHIDSEMLKTAGVDSTLDDKQKLEVLWSYYPHLMQQAKQQGPASIHQQHRMVTLEDYRNQLLAHPLVLAVDAYTRWSGAWNTHYVVIRLINNLQLDTELSKQLIIPDTHNIEQKFERFTTRLRSYYQQQQIEKVPLIEGRNARFLLQDVIKRQRMIGQEVLLQDATLVGIVLSISIKISGDYYRSEIIDAVQAALTHSPDGFFAPGKLQFGEDVVASDIIERLVSLEGIQSVCINRMKRIGSIYADQSGSGRIVLQGHEVAVLENKPANAERGLLRLNLHGGKAG